MAYRRAAAAGWVATGGGGHANMVKNKFVEQSDADSADWQQSKTWLGGDIRRAVLRRGHSGASMGCSRLLELTSTLELCNDYFKFTEKEINSSE